MKSMDNFPPLKITREEPEYKTIPSLPISSVGTDYSTADQTHLPYGSALMTDTLDGYGNGTSILKQEGITHIIHAAPKSEGEFTKRDDFIANVVKAVQNSIILAEKNNIEKLAICFVGGGIFCDNESTKPLLAEAIIKGALNQVKICHNLQKIIFVSFKTDRDIAWYLSDAWNSVKLDSNFSEIMEKKAGIVKGDIRKKSIHGANVIVNAANTYVGFGGGISGKIGDRTGNKVMIDNKATELIGEFYSKIDAKWKKGNKNGDSESAYFWLEMSLVPNWVPNNFHLNYYLFCRIGDEEPGQNINKSMEEGILISRNHPLVNRSDFLEVGLKSKYLIKFSKNKKIYEVGDQLEIEKYNKDQPLPRKGPPLPPNTPPLPLPDNKTASEWQAELKTVDNDLEQTFNENKVKEWKEQGKVQFGTVEGVKELVASVKNNSQFLNLIKTKKTSNSVAEFFAKNTPPEVIKFIKRFEYDNSSDSEKETRNKKMRKHYGLEKNATLSEEQINNFCYEVAIGQITESLIKIDEDEQGLNNTKTPENNILKILGIGALILIPLSLLLIIFVRNKRKKS